MDSHLKFAAIDIGSNAVRLLLTGVFEDGYSATFRKMSLVRMPIRLGDDAFTQKYISDGKISQLVKTMIGFKHLIESFQPLDFTRSFLRIKVPICSVATMLTCMWTSVAAVRK
jgi:exopolyphosphatase/pppGpp-phosphohydrolase